jgi:dTDP-4-amino-4,6-dideoxygalactose transaminase
VVFKTALTDVEAPVRLRTRGKDRSYKGIRGTFVIELSHSQAKNPVRIAKPFHNKSIEGKVTSILRSGMLVQGQFVKQFESKLSSYLGCKHVVAVNSGTAALQVGISAMKKLRNPKGIDIPEILTTPFSFAATANAVIGSGCVPVFADVDAETFNLDPGKAGERVSERTIAIEPVDVHGLPMDIDSLKREPTLRYIPIVEDSAEAIGASYKGKKVGNIVEISCFSTYATKNLHTAEGGFVTTNNDSLADEMRMTRNQGQIARYNQVTLGYNFRMQEVNAVMGLEQIRLLDELNAKRLNNVQTLKDGLKGLDCISFQKVDKPKEHSWYLFSLILDEQRAGISRDKLVQKLRERGIEADVAWPTPIHLQPYYRETFGYKDGDFPISEKISKTIFQLPIQPLLKQAELKRVVSAMKSVLA